MLSINVEGKPSLPLLQINLLGILLTKMFKFSEKKKIGTHINKMIIIAISTCFCHSVSLNRDHNRQPLYINLQYLTQSDAVGKNTSLFHSFYLLFPSFYFLLLSSSSVNVVPTQHVTLSTGHAHKKLAPKKTI